MRVFAARPAARGARIGQRAQARQAGDAAQVRAARLRARAGRAVRVLLRCALL